MVRKWTSAGETAYKLTVSDLHTYYVVAGATPVLVHNCGGNSAPSRTTWRGDTTSRMSWMRQKREGYVR
ncbi:hypothetical protein ACFS5L_44355 [Streptomyces phyllanthi]|uniref:Intein C-terminal splicing domain-containing protein n=1 Tax=Streptomyces phyllanthi TaxID=1803180 RepID=A0A5N8W869_9ACTN|nr:hypothetical protein [Streptomyces phyllanthi]